MDLEHDSEFFRPSDPILRLQRRYNLVDLSFISVEYVTENGSRASSTETAKHRSILICASPTKEKKKNALVICFPATELEIWQGVGT